MTINQFWDEYFSLNEMRQDRGLRSLFDYLREHRTDNESLILDILSICADYESNDMFGTEGLDI